MQYSNNKVIIEDDDFVALRDMVVANANGEQVLLLVFKLSPQKQYAPGEPGPTMFHANDGVLHRLMPITPAQPPAPHSDPAASAEDAPAPTPAPEPAPQADQPASAPAAPAPQASLDESVSASASVVPARRTKKPAPAPAPQTEPVAQTADAGQTDDAELAAKPAEKPAAAASESQTHVAPDSSQPESPAAPSATTSLDATHAPAVSSGATGAAPAAPESLPQSALPESPSPAPAPEPETSTTTQEQPVDSQTSAPPVVHTLGLGDLGGGVTH